MHSIRIFFSKRGRAKYISHLDMTRLFQRAVRRSGIEMWYTEGFHPHLYLTFALPLSLGIESDCESVDMRLLEDLPPETVRQRLNEALPPSVQVWQVDEPHCKASEITASRYRIVLPSLACAQQEMKSFLAQEEIPAVKKGKAGEREINIRPLVYAAEIKSAQDDLVLDLLLASGDAGTLNPQLLLRVFSEKTAFSCDAAQILRTEILCGDKPFS